MLDDIAFLIYIFVAKFSQIWYLIFFLYNVPYLLDLCSRNTIIFLPKYKDKTLGIVPHCGII